MVICSNSEKEGNLCLSDCYHSEPKCRTTDEPEAKARAIAAWNRRAHRPDSALRVALEQCLVAMRDHQTGQYRFNTKKAISAAEAALAQPQDAPPYNEAALDRFAEAGAKAWANPPESAKLIRQASVFDNLNRRLAEHDAQKDGERLDWLEKSKPFILAITPEESRWEISEPFDLAPLGSRLLGEGETLRAAIDAARSREEGKV